MKSEIYAKIVKAAKINEGEMVLVQYWMEDTFSEDVSYLMGALAKIGASPVLVVQNLNISQAVNENVTDKTYGPKFFKQYEDADVIIDLMERPIGVLRKPVDPERMGILGGYMGKLFQCCSTKKILQIRVPNETMAGVDGLSVDDYESRMIKAMDIDYESIAVICKNRILDVKDYDSVKIKSGDGEYFLELSFGNREWNIDAGEGDIPCGEIYIAPIENKTNGKVYFEKIYLPDPVNMKSKKLFNNIVLDISDGVIVNTNNDLLNEFIVDYGENNSTICELGFGLNPGVTNLCGCEVLDEKMVDTFHLGIGDNTMFGGANEADFHVDLVGLGEWNFI